MNCTDEFLPQVLGDIVEALARYPYPHLKELIQTTNLFIPSFLRDERNVEKCVDRVLTILTTEIDLDLMRETESSGPGYFSFLLEVLWEYPGYRTEIELEEDDYANFYMALVKDSVDVSMLPPPEG